MCYPADKNGKLGSVLCVIALVKCKGEGGEGGAACYSESCTLLDISSVRRRTVHDERLTLSKAERFSGQTQSTTAMSHSDEVHPKMASFCKQGDGRPHNWHVSLSRPL
ncbi:hypothetical protein Pcinc_010679 [Petrolisthes cinctipes]|uniref:Uncharacterized protein n=1 Tax=Petrolisthes cinctipes TaxID=88211 RepID=A0AAE1KU91_PETCI|nr:hypothetical protein Pcinc_010679 [Petrolisthes cinctipes]